MPSKARSKAALVCDIYINALCDLATIVGSGPDRGDAVPVGAWESNLPQPDPASVGSLCSRLCFGAFIAQIGRLFTHRFNSIAIVGLHGRAFSNSSGIARSRKGRCNAAMSTKSRKAIYVAASSARARKEHARRLQRPSGR
jgi:hypothetical protein